MTKFNFSVSYTDGFFPLSINTFTLTTTNPSPSMRDKLKTICDFVTAGYILSNAYHRIKLDKRSIQEQLQQIIDQADRNETKALRSYANLILLDSQNVSGINEANVKVSKRVLSRRGAAREKMRPWQTELEPPTVMSRANSPTARP